MRARNEVSSLDVLSRSASSFSICLAFDSRAVRSDVFSAPSSSMCFSERASSSYHQQKTFSRGVLEQGVEKKGEGEGSSKQKTSWVVGGSRDLRHQN